MWHFVSLSNFLEKRNSCVHLESGTIAKEGSRESSQTVKLSFEVFYEEKAIYMCYVVLCASVSIILLLPPFFLPLLPPSLCFLILSPLYFLSDKPVCLSEPVFTHVCVRMHMCSHFAFEQRHKSKPGPEDQFLMLGHALVSCFLRSWLCVFLFCRFVHWLAQTLHVSSLEEIMIS